MRVLLQRVSTASVLVEGEQIAQIGGGLLLFIAIHRDDEENNVQRAAKRILQLRIFPDDMGKMNRSVTDIQGALLIVSQFTLYGDTSRGNRPSFSESAAPDKARYLYEVFIRICKESGLQVQTGRFQAHMDVKLVNDGPVTILYESES